MERTPSLRRLWQVYKQVLLKVPGELRRRDMLLAQASFYAGAQSTFKVLCYLLEHGEIEELERFLTQQAKQLKVIEELATQERLH